jgi:threonine/homoserine/homoserine lactone efflux protein
VAALVTGAALGLTIAVPIGPIATLCISRTLARGPLAGIVTGLGSATVHAAYGTVAVFGGDAARESLQLHARPMHVAGGLLLCLVGLLMLKRTLAPGILLEQTVGFSSDYTSAAAIAIFNPMTLAMFVAGLSAFDAEGANPMELVLGVVLGSSSWYALLVLFIAAAGRRLPVGLTRRINRIAALAVCAMGAIAVVDLV